MLFDQLGAGSFVAGGAALHQGRFVGPDDRPTNGWCLLHRHTLEHGGRTPVEYFDVLEPAIDGKFRRRAPVMRRPLLALLALAVLVAVAAGLDAVRRDRAYRRLLGEGDAAMARGDTFAAVEAFSGAVALRPGALAGWVKRGTAHRQRGDLPSALRDLRRATAIDSGSVRALEELGDVLAGMERYPSAADRYQAALALDDRSARLLYKLALARLRSGQADDAEAAVTRAIALVPGFPEAHYLRGLILEERGRNVDARDAFRRAIAEAPAMLAPREDLAALSVRAGGSSEEISQLEALVALDGDRPQRYEALALAYGRAARTDLAVATIARARDRFPQAPGLDATLGEVWLQASAAGDASAPAKALQALARAGAADDSSRFHLLHARALLAAGQATSALRALERATTRFPVTPGAFALLAHTAETLGRPALASRARRADTALTAASVRPAQRR